MLLNIQGCFCVDFCPVRQVWNRSHSRQFHLSSLMLVVSHWGIALGELDWWSLCPWIEMLSLVYWEGERLMDREEEDHYREISEKQIMKLSASDSCFCSKSVPAVVQLKTFYIKSIWLKSLWTPDHHSHVGLPQTVPTKHTIV